MKLKPIFRNGYERMAYVALEVLTKHQTEGQLAEQLGLSHQRVSQIYIAALARVGCTANPDPAEVGLRFRRFLSPLPAMHTVEFFSRHELMFRGEYRPLD